MSGKAARWLVWFGFFLIVMGVLTVALLGPRAKTGLYSGLGIGALSILWGVLMRRNLPWVLPVAIGNVGFAALAFFWRAFIAWNAWAFGKPDRLIPAVFTTLMFLAAIAVFTLLIRTWQAEEAAAGR